MPKGRRRGGAPGRSDIDLDVRHPWCRREGCPRASPSRQRRRGLTGRCTLPPPPRSKAPTRAASDPTVLGIVPDSLKGSRGNLPHCTQKKFGQPNPENRRPLSTSRSHRENAREMGSAPVPIFGSPFCLRRARKPCPRTDRRLFACPWGWGSEVFGEPHSGGVR